MKCPMEDLSSSFGQRIRFLRDQTGESLQDIADAIGITKGHLWELEAGSSSNPGLNIIIAAAKYFEVPAAALVETVETAKFMVVA